MKSLLRYVPPLEEDHGVWFVNVCIMDIVKDTISLHFLAVSSRGTGVHYIRDSKIMAKHQDMLLVFGKLAKKRSSCEDAITNLHDPDLLIYFERHILLMI